MLILYFILFLILDSERSSECIDCTMCVFLVYVYLISSRNHASIFNFSILFDGKVNLVGALGGQNPIFP